jgi:hypothetical protein
LSAAASAARLSALSAPAPARRQPRPGGPAPWLPRPPDAPDRPCCAGPLLDLAQAGPCQLPWQPGAKDFLDALVAHGYQKAGGSSRGRSAGAAAAAAAAAEGGLPRLMNLQLLLRLLQRLCQLQAGGHAGLQLELAGGHGKQLAMALAHLQVDVEAGALLGPDLQAALGALLDAADAERFGADVAAGVLQLGGSHRAKLQLLSQLPDAGAKQRDVQALVAYLLLRELLQAQVRRPPALLPAGLAARWPARCCRWCGCGRTSFGTDRALAPLLTSPQGEGGSARLRRVGLQQALELLPEPARAGEVLRLQLTAKGKKRPDHWRLLTVLEALDLLMWPLVEEAEAEGRAQEAEEACKRVWKVVEAWDFKGGAQDVVAATVKATIPALTNKYKFRT